MNVMFQSVFFCMLLTIVTLTLAESRDSTLTSKHTDDYALQLFLKELFGEIWGYYLGWIFSAPPTLVVLPAKVEFHNKNHTNKRQAISSSSRLGGTQTSTSRDHIVHKQTCERQCHEEITVNKFIAMVFCFGIYGIIAAIPEWKEGKRRKWASSEELSNECNCTENTDDRSPMNACSPNSLSATKHNKLFIDASLTENIKVHSADGTVVTLDKQLTKQIIDKLQNTTHYKGSPEHGLTAY